MVQSPPSPGPARRRHTLSTPVLLESLESRVLLDGINITSLQLKSLASLNGGGGGSGNTPQGLVMAPNGDLYGTSSAGGKKGYGVLFKIAEGTHIITTIAAFDGKNGITPRGGMVFDADGNLFGVATGGGAYGKGTIWELLNGSTTIARVASFAGTNGTYPISGLTADASGNFYGTTLGFAGSLTNRSEVFELPHGSSTITPVAYFHGNIISTAQLTVDSSGDIYGTTRNGGKNGLGTVFKIDAGTTTMKTLFTFTGAGTGSAPDGQLFIDTSGNIFGTTSNGGTNGVGTLFEIASGGTFSRLVSFGAGNGNRPIGNFVEDTLGHLYGVCSSGGANGTGTIYKFTHNGTVSAAITIFNFRGDKTGVHPSGPLIFTIDDHFFGTTSQGGQHQLGAVFELAPPGL